MTPTKRKKTHNRKDGGSSTKYVHEESMLHQSIEAEDLFHSYSPDLQQLVIQGYDLKAPFAENMKILNHIGSSASINQPKLMKFSSEESPSPKEDCTRTESKSKGYQKTKALTAHKGNTNNHYNIDEVSENGQAVSQRPSNAGNMQSKKEVRAQLSLPKRPTSPLSCITSSIEVPQPGSRKGAHSTTGLSNTAQSVSNHTSDAEVPFNPPKAPRSHLLPKSLAPAARGQGGYSKTNHPDANLLSYEHSNRSVKAPLNRCNCNLPSFFTAHYHRIPNIKNWTGEKEDFLRHVRNFANCNFHPSNVKGACRKIVKSHEASVSRQNEVQLFKATDLSKGIFSNKNGSYEVYRGRSQSTIAPDNFYVSARNANQGEPPEGLGLKADISKVFVVSQQSTPKSFSPDRVSRGSPMVSDNRRHRAPFAGLGKSHSLANGTSASSVAIRQDSVDSIYKQQSQSSSEWSSGGNSPSTPKAESISTVREGKGEKEVEGVIDWAMDCLERDLASSQSPQSMIQDVSPHEEDQITQVSPKKPEQSLRQQSPPDFSSRAKRHQSLPARLATPGPVAIKPSQTPGDRIKEFAREHLAKVPNLSLVDIKRVVEELDRRLTDIEADKEASRSTRSSDQSENVTPSNIIHYSPRRGFRNESSASTSQTATNATGSTPKAAHTNNFTPVNQHVSTTANATRDANAMPPPPLQPKRKSKSIAEQKLEKPELSPDVPQNERLPEADIIDLGRRKLAYTRHESAPYAFNYRGKLRKEYRYLLTKVGLDGKTVWIAEEVARLS